MKVICKVNNLSDFSDKKLLERLHKYISISSGEVDLSIGNEYTVYGIVFWDNSPWYYLCSEDYDEYPKPFAAEFFDLVDERLSSHWKLSAVDQGEGEILSSLVFYEWANDPSFYEKLLEEDTKAIALFAKYRNILDQEYT